jgi:F0F1-type ATP synthase assembly protein I
MRKLTRTIAPKRPVATSGDSLGRGAEMAISVLVFCVIGLVLDAIVGTTPTIAIALVVFSLVGNFVRMYYQYKAAMDVQLAQRLSQATRHQQETAPR